MLFIFEYIGIKLSYENHSWWFKGLLTLFALLNIFPILFYVFNKRWIALVLVFIIALFIIPPQIYWTYESLLCK